MYLEWNRLLAKHFFTPEMAGRPVHLYVTAELISELGAPRGLGVQDFVDAVKVGPPWTTRHGLCQIALQTCERWRERHLDYPPYIAFLSLFVLAAGVEGEFAPNAYYPRLRKLIGEPWGGTLPSFDRMWELWDDLERWSNRDKQGEIGTFVAQFAGSWFHVGLPIAQTVLTEHERRSLPKIFAEADIDPTAPPADFHLVRALQRYGPGILRPRTLALLSANSAENDLRDALVQTVREELVRWDGLEPPAPEATASGRRSVHGALRLCATLDRVAKSLKVSLRCRVNRDLPEEGLSLRDVSDGCSYTCYEVQPGWSSPLVDSRSERQVDAAVFDWRKGIILRDSEHGWQARLMPEQVRVFASGSSEGLPGLVELHQLMRSTPLYIAAHQSALERIKSWGISSCTGFQHIEIQQGLPPGWSLFKVDDVISDREVRQQYHVLSLSSVVRMSFREGLRYSQGNVFFDFAPPLVVFEGGDGTETLWCNSQLLPYDPELAAYTLPPDLPPGDQLVVEVHHGEDVILRRSLYLMREFDWRNVAGATLLDPFGLPVLPAQDSCGAAGALVQGNQDWPYYFPMRPQTYDSHALILLGPCPGQVAHWPKEPVPVDWSPVWAIAVKRRAGQAIFCANDTDDIHPDLTAQYGDSRRVRLWKKALWYSRRRIVPPEPNYQQLWRDFQEAARSV